MSRTAHAPTRVQSPPNEASRAMLECVLAHWKFRYALTDAELNVAREIVTGCSNKEAAMRLCVTPATIRTQLSSVLLKARADGRARLAYMALRDGVVLATS